MRFRKLFLSTLIFCSFSLAAFAHEAPVEDLSQQPQQDNTAVSTQPEESSGGSWQPVTSDNANSKSATQDNAWQPVSTVKNNSMPANESPLTDRTDRTYQSTPLQESSSAPSGTVDRRVARLEQQVSNYTQMNLPQQVSDLQQKNAQLQGQLEVAQHNLKTLTDQQKLYYQDLQQQIAQLEKQKSEAAAAKASADKTNKTNKTSSNKKDDTADNGFVKKDNIPTSNASSDSDDNSKTANTAQLTSTTPSSNDNVSVKVPSLSDADSYGKAFRSLSDKHFDMAQTEFHQYLTDYPKGHFAVNAHFWLGEIALMHEKYGVATKQFQTVVSQYPASTKVPDAKLKIAMIDAARGKMELARSEFTQIRKLYPGSTAAQLASIRLQQLANATSVDAQ